MTRKSWWLPILAGALVLAACDKPDPSGMVGKPAPDFEVSPAKAGGNVRLIDYKGKVVLLDFWATWCGPCRALMPYVSNIQQKYRDKGLVVMGISNEPLPLVSQFRLANPELAYELYSDKDAKASNDYHAEEIPTTVLIGRDGKVVYWDHGASNESVKELESRVKAALSAN